MSPKTIRIADLGVPSDYRSGLVPLIIESLGYKIEWTNALRADLVIYGSFYDVNAPRLRWLPRAWRKEASHYFDVIEKKLFKRQIPPITLFQTAENLRYDHIKADYAISHDLNVKSKNHFRLPYWMEMIDWAHEGIIGNQNPRYGQLLNLDRLLTPLGDEFMRRDQKAILITSHLREPRAACYATLKSLMPVDGMGPYFDRTIKDHHKSVFIKKDILINYRFNLCPENSIYPGYVTEKIPEAFAAGCLPITMVDNSVGVDFNPNAMINLAATGDINLEWLNAQLSAKALQKYSEQPLLLRKIYLEDAKTFIGEIVSEVV